MKTYTDINEDEIEQKALSILKRKGKFSEEGEAIDKITDEDWLRQSFISDGKYAKNIDKQLRSYSTAEFKFQDSSLGGNYAVNPRPQFTPYADTRIKGRMMHRNEVTLTDTSGDHGMGHFYSEAHDDNAQVIHMRFGVPQFVSMTTFFTGFFNYKVASVARTGRGSSSLFFKAGQAAGYVVLLVLWPLTVASILPNAIRFLSGKPASKFYSLKPTMPLYWYAVNTMVNQIGVNRGLFPEVIDSNKNQKSGDTFKLDERSVSALSDLMPDMFSPTGGIDVYAVANRTQRLKNKLDTTLNSMLKEEGGSEEEPFDGFIKKFDGQIISKQMGQRGTIADAINKWFLSDDAGKQNSEEKDNKILVEKDFRETKPASPNGWEDHLLAEYDDGSQYATFRVDYTGPVGESFSNSLVESQMASQFNSTSSSAKATYFKYSGGNIAPFLDGVTTAFKDFVGGTLDSISASGFLALAGSAFVDIPKHWENSMAQLPRANYSVTLISPYGNVLSQMINMYIPLSMLLAGTLPIQTGKQSYTSPFILELFDRGRQTTRLGMIDSLSITRGTSNLGFNRNGEAMAIEVSFTIADLSSVMSMPIVSRTFLEEAIPDVFDDDNVYTDYLNTLSSLTLGQQTYKMSKLKLNMANKVRRIEQLISPARMVGVVHGWPVTGLFDIFFKGTEKK